MGIDFKKEMREFLGPTNLTKTRFFVSMKPMDIVLVDKNKNFISASLKVVLPSFEDFNNS